MCYLALYVSFAHVRPTNLLSMRKGEVSSTKGIKGMRSGVLMYGGVPMNEAQRIHEELLHALLPLIPRTTYQDLRRLNTLAWAIVGLYLTHTVRLGAWAEVLEGRAQYAASRVRRFAELSASSCYLSTTVV